MCCQGKAGTGRLSSAASSKYDIKKKKKKSASKTTNQTSFGSSLGTCCPVLTRHSWTVWARCLGGGASLTPLRPAHLCIPRWLLCQEQSPDAQDNVTVCACQPAAPGAPAKGLCQRAFWVASLCFVPRLFRRSQDLRTQLGLR